MRSGSSREKMSSMKIAMHSARCAIYEQESLKCVQYLAKKCPPSGLGRPDIYLPLSPLVSMGQWPINTTAYPVGWGDILLDTVHTSAILASPYDSPYFEWLAKTSLVVHGQSNLHNLIRTSYLNFIQFTQTDRHKHTHTFILIQLHSHSPVQFLNFLWSSVLI